MREGILNKTNTILYMICSICFTEKWSKYNFIKGKISTECGHVFCRGCLNQWINSNNAKKYTCPVCRTYLSYDWRTNLCNEISEYINNKPKTRLYKSRERVTSLWNQWRRMPNAYEKDSMKKVLEEISKENYCFKNDKVFRKKYNELVNTIIQINGSEFEKYIK